ncbi:MULTISPECIES: dipeptidase [unclassified Sphingomonas]|uniref:dipeptidase n=1 Tax=unclassified Sphingomonas TaxID=196159 RepID=UPI0006F91B01|nr:MULTISPECIES: membrane dipeptidase [unclassified Sphingomonas]KQX25310.1 peptidase M19 [Sphingomonas sp. Root1294]KQY66301.1 peptidase M19 [Sphingomonas sp. Root50]KRB90389.1 peptidase M19 [Sphingomonas sp. Root720]
MTIDRRDFLSLATSAAAVAAMPGPLLAAAGRDPVKDWILVNALGGLSDPNGRDASLVPAFGPRVLAEAHASGLTAVNITLGYVSGSDDPFEASVRDIALTDRLVREHGRDLIKVLTVADIRRAKAEGKIGLIYGFQNGAMMGKDASRVDVFADLGVRIFQLTYNPANQIGDGSMAPENRGITPFGRELIAKLNDRRAMVDLSHSGEQTCLEAARASRAPISINHTGCRALTDLPRNKTDAELRLVAERGGFVGIYFMPFLNISGHASAEDVVAHIDHAVSVCGEDHVGIGTDGDVSQIDDLNAYQAKLAEEIARRRAAGISAAGERPDTYPFVVDLRGPDQFRKLVRLLQARGYASARIEKIMGANFLRYAETVWGG